MSTPAEPPAAAGDETDPAVAPARSGSRVLAAWTGVLAVVVLAADQLTKWWAESALAVGGDPIPFVGELLQLRLIYNPGAALSIASGMTWVLTVVVVVVVVFIVRAIGRLGSRSWAVALGLLLGGALGNLTDRLLREPGFARGHVVDFIDYAGFFVGNVADIAVVGGAILIALLSVIGIGMDGKRHADAADDSAAADGKAADTADAGSADVDTTGTDVSGTSGAAEAGPRSTPGDGA